MNKDNIGLIAAGVAYYFLMASFPAIAAGISLFGLFSDPAVIVSQIDLLRGVLPRDALDLLTDQATKIAAAGSGALGAGFLLGLFLTVYGTTQSAKALITGFNIAFDVEERRNILVFNVTAYILTLFLILYFLIAVAIMAIVPAAIAFLRLPEEIGGVLLFARWPLMFMLALIGVSLLYRFAPARKSPGWRLFSWGALLATGLWVSLSSLFSFYVSNFGSYNETYGSLGAVIILLLWFWLTAMAVLAGAELDATIEQMEGENAAV